MAMHTKDARFDRFDICEAWFLFASHYHGGQDSKEYAIFGRLKGLQFSPSPMLSQVKDLSPNGQIIYTALVEKVGRHINYR